VNRTVFLAGATGVIGSVLVKLLVEEGYRVFGTTRRENRADYLRSLGAKPIVVDVFDAERLSKVLMYCEPTDVVHQLTDFPRDLDPSQMPAAIARIARVRTEGTRNLIAAMQASGCKSLIAQSTARAYAPPAELSEEDAELTNLAEGLRQVSVSGIVALEQQVLYTPGINGAVLRYGDLYGPGTGTEQPSGASPLHVEAAAYAAFLALRLNIRGVFNVAEENAEVTSEKIRRVLGWVPELRLPRAGCPVTS
jgi:nucleoside-diphosphate-sugar epimerase